MLKNNRELFTVNFLRDVPDYVTPCSGLWGLFDRIGDNEELQERHPEYRTKQDADKDSPEERAAGSDETKKEYSEEELNYIRSMKNEENAKKAARICKSCKLIEACATHAILVKENSGVWGGLSQKTIGLRHNLYLKSLEKDSSDSLPSS